MRSEQELRDRIEIELNHVRYIYEEFKAGESTLRFLRKIADNAYHTISGYKFALDEEWNLGEFNRLVGFTF